MDRPSSAELVRTTSNNETLSIASFLRNGGRAVLLTGPSSATTSLLEAVLGNLPGPALRVANPLKAPLSLSRLVRQVCDDWTDDQDAGLSGATRAAMDSKTSLVLAIADAHTMEPEALRAVVHLVQTGDPTLKALRLIIEGRRDLVGLLDAAGLDLLSSIEKVMLVEAKGEFEQPPHASPLRDQARSEPSAATTCSLNLANQNTLPDQSWPPLFEVGSVTAMLAIAATLLLMLPSSEAGSDVAAAPAEVAASLSSTAAAPAASLTAEMMPASEPPPLSSGSSELLPGRSEAELRSDFRAFLARRGYANQSQEAQDALFREYKEWLASNRSAQADQPTVLRVVHVDRRHSDPGLD